MSLPNSEKPRRSCAELVRERVQRFGPLPFEEFLELALYGDGVGFYETQGGARQHFLTSPEIGPLFGAVIARALDAWWVELGSPDPFVVVEAAAGRGALCRAVLGASPACSGALRYVLVERSGRLRAEQASVVPLEPASDVIGPVAPADEEDHDGARALPGRGPRVTSLPDLPADSVVGVVLANELLDNLPFVLLEWDGRSWAEVRVDGDGGEVLVPAAESLVAEAERLLPSPPEVSARVPLQRRAAAWLRDAFATVERGRVVVVDYASTTPGLAARPWREWVRTYRRGGPGVSPFQRPGEQDVTCEVCVDQLARVRAPLIDRSQAEFLRAHGIDALVADAHVASAPLDSMGALRARSRLSEADALCDLAGLGAFRVLEWATP